MKYNYQLKANNEIFENPKFLEVQNLLVLQHPRVDLLEEDAHLYVINSNNPEVKQFLPTVAVNNQVEAIAKLKDFMTRMIFKHSLFYIIRIKENNLPIGYIHANSPISSTGIDDWSLDFWINSNMSGKGIMRASLVELLNHLKENLVFTVKAIVDKKNTKCIKVLETIGFGLLNSEYDSDRYIYGITLIDPSDET